VIALIVFGVPVLIGIVLALLLAGPVPNQTANLSKSLSMPAVFVVAFIGSLAICAALGAIWTVIVGTPQEIVRGSAELGDKIANATIITAIFAVFMVSSIMSAVVEGRRLTRGDKGE